MATATDTSFLPPLPGRAERPGMDVREHPGRIAGRGPAGGVVYLREIQRVIMECNLRDQIAQRREH